MLKFYNSMGRKLQPFKPIVEGKVRMYTCGPTVWNYAHIGNFRTFIFEDLLRRYLKFKGYEVTQVMNITDVEDRIIKAVGKSGKSLAELTGFYEQAFMEDLASLNVERAEHYPRATDHIKEIVALILRLQEKGYAYKAPDGSYYFDISKFKKYGALSGVKLEAVRSAERVSQDYYEDKREAVDFALWKAWEPKDGDVSWDTELGRGRPGWHIECSAMAMKYLGESFDIHTGGIDHRFPHHENEIAQSEGATGKKFARFWLHADFLNMEGEAMHKSVGNVVYLRDLVAKGWDPLVIRLFLISSRYRDPSDLTDSALRQARSQRERLQECIARLKSVVGGGSPDLQIGSSFLKDFEDAMDDDLNTAQAFAALFTFVKKLNVTIDAGKAGRAAADSALDALHRVNSVLGVMTFEDATLPPKLATLLARREEARKKRDFEESDRLRDQLLAEGIVLEDTPSGTRWKRTAGG